VSEGGTGAGAGVGTAAGAGAGVSGGSADFAVSAGCFERVDDAVIQRERGREGVRE